MNQTSSCREFVTEMGSVYRRLPDGRFERFKTVEGKVHKPADVTVFVPCFEWVNKEGNVPEKYRRFFGGDETDYIQILQDRIGPEGRRAYVVDGVDGVNRRELKSFDEVNEVKGPLYLVCGNEKRLDFYVPVSRDVKKGYFPFEIRY